MMYSRMSNKFMIFGRCIWISFLVLFAVACGRPQEQPQQATININTDVPAVIYNPMIFGGFLEHFGTQIYGGVFDPGSPLSDENGFRTDAIKALKELKIQVVRWPGGCFVDGYDWKKGVGKDREPADDMAWGVIEPNTFGTDEFIKLCRLVEWEPYICTNAGTGTIEEMKDWVEYTNSTSGEFAQMRKENGNIEPMNVRIWSIGNENYGKDAIGWKPIKEWAPYVRKAAKEIKAANPTVKLSAAALITRKWSLPLLEQAGEYLDYLSIHGYWMPLWQKHYTTDYLSCIIKSEEPELMIQSFIQVLDESGYRGRIKIAFDEWNLRGWHHPGFPRKELQDYDDPEVAKLVKAREKNDIASQYTMADALFSASFLNACLRHAEDVEMANIAPVVNTRGPLYVHPDGIVKRTHFHALSMYANQLEEQVCNTALKADWLANEKDSIPVFDGIATVDKSGANWAISLVNRHPTENVHCTVMMGGKPLNGKYKATVLAGDLPDSYNDIDFPNRVVPEEVEVRIRKGIAILPPHSLTIVHVPLIIK